MRKRIYYTEGQKGLMWERWRQGESLQQIAQLFGRNHSSVQGILVQSGGIQPPKRQRSARVLSLQEREEISRGLAAGNPRPKADLTGWPKLDSGKVLSTGALLTPYRSAVQPSPGSASLAPHAGA
jgi:hypothetical protein